MKLDNKSWHEREKYLGAIGTVYSVTLGFFVVLSMMFATLVNQIDKPEAVEAAACAIPTSVTTTIELTPDSADNIIDCSSQDITVTSTGKLIFKSYKTANASNADDGGVILKVGNLTIDAGGQVVSDGQGYTAGDVDGGSAEASIGIAAGSGGGHGGAGGSGNTIGGVNNTVGATGGSYGSKDYPLSIGGAGGNAGGGGTGGAGGGAIKVEASGTVTINGSISADGLSGAKSADEQTAGGGGAGGSVWIQADILVGSGTVSAKGGSTDMTASYYGGGGGGGRIALICITSTTFSSANALVTGGIGSQNGQIGSLVGPGCKPPEPTVLRFYEKNDSAHYVDRELQVGELTRKTALTFASDLDGSDLKLEVEVKEVGETFSNTASFAQISAASNKQCTGIPESNGVDIDGYCGYVEVTSGLSINKEYKWQARVVSVFGSSNWVQFGGNASSDTDFTIVGAPSEIVIVEGNNQSVTVGQVAPINPKIKVTDSSGRGIPYYALTGWSVSAGGGSLANTVNTTDKWGFATTEWIIGTVAGVGNNSLVVSQSGDALEATFTASALPGAIASYLVEAATSLTLVNNAFSYTVTPKDIYQNSVAFTDDLTVVPVSGNDEEVPGLGTLTPNSITTNASATPITVSDATYNYTESIKIRVYDPNGKEGFSRSILFVNAIGSCPAITIEANQTWNAVDVPGGIFDCRGLGTLTVKDDAVLSLQSYNNGDIDISNDYGVTILADALDVRMGSSISGTGLGYPSWVVSQSGEHGGYTSTGAGTPYGDVYEPVSIGSGGGITGWSTYPGAGGGAIKLGITGTTTVNGTIASNGTCMSGYGSADGGAGGSFWLDTTTLAGAGTISVNGGCGTAEAGSGGRMAIYYTTNAGFTLEGTNLQAYGGRHYGYFNTWETTGWGGAGTVYVEQKGVDAVQGGLLIVDNSGNNGNFAVMPEDDYKFREIKVKRYGHVEFVGQDSTLEITSGAGMVGDNTKPQIKVSGTLNYTGTELLNIDGVDLALHGKAVGINDVTVGATLNSGLTLYGQTWYHSDTVPYQFGHLLVTSLGTVQLISQNDKGVFVELSDLTVEAGGVLTGDGTGYASAAGVDSVYEPLSLGINGAGGSMKLTVSGTTTLDGTIRSDGACNAANGGRIWIDTGVITGSGSISASGSCSPWNSFGGTGGRVGLYFGTNVDFPLDGEHLKAYGGRWVGRWDWNATDGWGAPGTIYVEHKGVDDVHGGLLIVDNNGHNAGLATMPEASYKFAKIQVTRYGHVEFVGQGNVLEITSGAGMVGDNTKPQIKISGTLQYTSADRLNIDGVDLGLNGKAVGINDVTVGATLTSGLSLYAHTWYQSEDVPYQFGDMKVTSLGTVQMISQNEQGVFVELTGLEVENGGVITADGTAYASVAGAENLYEPSELGVNGAGGVIKLTVSGTTVLDGAIHSNGACNAAKGGNIWLDTNTLTGSGYIEASGSCSPWNSFGGAGGRIALYYQTNTDFPLDATHLRAYGGRWVGRWDWNTTDGWGVPGTVYVEHKGTDTARAGKLLVDNNGHNNGFASIPEGDYSFSQIVVTRYGHAEFLGQGSTLEITSGGGMVGDSTKPQIKISGTLNYTSSDRLQIDGVDLGLNGKVVGINDITVGSTLASGLSLYAKTWYQDEANPYRFGDVYVTGLGTVQLISQNNEGVFWEVENLTIDEGGVVTGDGTGYAATAGVDSVYEPKALGTGGTGGSIKLTVSGTATINGYLQSNGACNASKGGNIWLIVGTLTGNGYIEASGTCSPWNWFGGSGGRVALYYTSNAGFPLDGGHLRAYGGRWASRWDWYATDGWGTPGTIYVEQQGVDAVHGGKLLVDNNSHNNGAATVPESAYKFSQIVVSRYGHVEFVGQGSTLEITSGEGIVGDSTKPQVKVSGTFTYASEERLEINGIDLALNGKVVGVRDVTVGTTLPSGFTIYGKTWWHSKTVPYEFGDILVTGLGKLTMASQNNEGVFANFQNLTINENGILSADETGNASSAGTDNFYEPTALGISGAGGLIKLTVSGTTTIDGLVSAYGACNYATGGRIWLDTNVISGSGIITASACTWWAGGQGGRVALYYDSNTNFPINSDHIQAFGGNNLSCGWWGCNLGGSWNGPGTVYVEDRSIHQPHHGNLIIDNNDKAGTGETFAAGIYQLDNVTIGKNVTVWVSSDTTAIVDPLMVAIPHARQADNSTIASYAMDDTTSTYFTDASGNEHHGTPGPNTYKVAGKFGNAQKVSAGDLGITTSPISISGDWSVQMWVKFPLPSTVDGWRTLVHNNNNIHHVIVHSNGQMGLWNGSFQDSGYNVNALSGWHHVAATTGSTTKFYIDGSLVGSVGTTVHDAITVIGNAGYNQNTGWIDEVRISNKALSAEELLAFAQAETAGVTDNNTLALWHLDEEVYKASDSSSAAVAVTEVGTPTVVSGKFGNGRTVAAGQQIRTEEVSLGDDWTIDMWAQFPLPSTGEGWRTLAAYASGNYHPIIVSSDGYLGSYNGGWYSTGHNINALSGWHHVAAVGIGSSTIFYIDGANVGTATTKVMHTISSFANVGNLAQQSGTVDEIRVRNRAVSANEIATDATAVAKQSADESTLVFIHFDSVSPLQLDDASTNNYAVTAYGTALTGGKYSSAREFYGMRDYLQLPTMNPDFSQGVTFSFWAKPTAAPSYARIIDIGNGAGVDNTFIAREGTGNNLYIQTIQDGGNAYLIASNALVQNEWHHYVATIGISNNAAIYRDGVLLASGTVPLPRNIQRTKNYIGKSNYNDPLYTGLLDDVTILNKALTIDEVRALASGYTVAEYQGYQSKLVGQGVRFELDGNFTLESGASILGTGVGFSSDNGAGRGGRGVGYSGGGGGGNGGDGGNGQSDGANQPATGGVKFGDQLLPLSLGAGGGSSGVGAKGGAGGGAFGVIAHGRLNSENQYVDGHITIDGTINMNGAVGNTGSPGGGGGAGGSILLHGNTCSINGTLSAQGGAGGNSDIDGGGGGGGRVSVLYNVGPCEVNGTVAVTEGVPADAGSYSGQIGQVGTFPPEPNSVPWPSQYREQFELKEDVQSALQTPNKMALANTEDIGKSVLGITESAIPVGGVINGTTVTLKADAYDAGARPVSPKRLKIQVELKKVNQAFDGTTNLHDSGTETFTGGTPIVLSVTLTSLEMGASYKWRVRTVNVDTGLMSEWKEYGGNTSEAADFSITTVASLTVVINKDTMELPDTASVTVTARNSLGQVDTSYRGTISFTSSSGTATLPESYTFTGADNGVHTFSGSLKFFEAGNFSVTAADTVNLVLTDTDTITITVPGVPFISLSASSTLVALGESVNLIWQSGFLTNLTIDNGIGSVDSSGTRAVTPPLGVTTYTIQGQLEEGGFLTASVVIEVSAQVTPTPTESETATPTTTTQPTVTATTTPSTPASATPSATSTPTSTPTQSVVVRPRPTPVVISCPIIETFVVSNRIIKEGEPITISWAVGNADFVSIDAFSGSLSRSGSASVILKESAEITLFASKGNCKRTQQKHVEVVNAYPWEGAGGLLIGLFALETIGMQVGAAQGNLWFALLGLIDRRKKRKAWGVVYNAVTKKLLPRVVVRLWDAESGKLVDTVVTDAYGIFKLTPKEGKYVVKASLSGFTFPTKLIKSESDSGYSSIYSGEVIEVKTPNDILMISIPLDPVRIQKSGISFSTVVALLDEFVALLSPVILLAGFVYSIVVSIMYPLTLNYIILGLYGLTFIVKAFMYLSGPKMFGQVVGIDGKAVSGLELGLFDKEFKTLIARTFTNKRGAYNFVAKNQAYYLQVMDPGYKLLSKSATSEGIVIPKAFGNSGVRLISEQLIVYPVQKPTK